MMAAFLALGCGSDGDDGDEGGSDAPGDPDDSGDPGDDDGDDSGDPGEPEVPTVEVTPGDDLAALAQEHDEGTRFVLTPGVYRMQHVVPRDGQQFIGEPGAIMNGSRVLTEFEEREPGRWVATGQTQEYDPHGDCWPEGYQGCLHPEGVFVDEEPLWQVGSRANLEPGTFFFNYARDEIWLADDPTGKMVEASVAEHAFRGEAADVLVRGLIVEKYANTAQFGAIEGRGPGWSVEDSEVRLNHGVGIAVIDGGHIVGNNVHHQGQLGVTVGGGDILVEGNEIHHNQIAGFFWGWEGGGSKFAECQDLVVRDNHVYSNNGPGLWTDIDNIRVLYEGNVVEDNEGPGIFHEISYDAELRNNEVRGNGREDDTWVWGSQILVAASSNVDIHDNLVEVLPPTGNGITLADQGRGKGPLGPYLTQNVQVHDNEIVIRGGKAWTGGSSDIKNPNDPAFGIISGGGNLFDRNRYRILDGGDLVRWVWDSGGTDGEHTFESFQALGQEKNGTLSFE